MSKFLNISTDNSLGGDSASDEVVSSQKALKTYIDSTVGYTAGDGINITDNEISVDGEEAETVDGEEAETVDVEQASTVASSTISGWSMPSSNYIDLTLGASGATYTAPANGWFAGWTTQSPGNFQFMNFMVGNVNDGYACEAVIPSSFQCPTLLPVKKGQVMTVQYNTSGLTMFRFYYAESENV